MDPGCAVSLEMKELNIKGLNFLCFPSWARKQGALDHLVLLKEEERKFGVHGPQRPLNDDGGNRKERKPRLLSGMCLVAEGQYSRSRGNEIDPLCLQVYAF